ncbi:LL-diaminopimelate aminotransferase [Patescibacteria group bacterium]|nr:LL-diaminopimelate aminotransferase [Patescibacteria group bacterium]
MSINLKKTKRLSQLPPYLFTQLDREKEKLKEKGWNLIDFGVGDPDLPTPLPIVNRLIQACQNPKNHRYPSYEGLISFREAVSKWYQKRFGVTLDPQREVITLIGSKEGIAHICLGLLNPGDVVLIPDPAYPVYRAGVIFAGGKPFYLPLREENKFLPALDTIPERVACSSKILWINYPNNPTAATATVEFFHRVIDFAKKFNLIVCHDLAYSEISFDGYQPPSLLQVRDGKEIGVEFHSLSKSFNMTGWRIGFAVGNAKIIRTLREVKTNIDSGVFQAIQEAGIEALQMNDEAIREIKKVYQRRRDIIIDGLQKLGWEINPPQATFYLWVKVPGKKSSLKFTLELLRKYGIVVTPGVGFGPSGEGYIRIALTVNEKRIKEAIQRLTKKI